ncbi:MAG: hypothetical protein AAGE13_15455, partial [Pseudomonadota bacterium]
CLLAGRLAAAQMTSLRPENRPAVPKALFEHLRRRRGHQLFRSTTPARRKQGDWSATNTPAEVAGGAPTPPEKNAGNRQCLMLSKNTQWQMSRCEKRVSISISHFRLTSASAARLPAAARPPASGGGH